MTPIKCASCGKEISDEANFCPNCGYLLPVFSAVNPVEEIYNSGEEPASHRKLEAGNFWPEIVVFALCIWFFVCIIYQNNLGDALAVVPIILLSEFLTGSPFVGRCKRVRGERTQRRSYFRA